MRPEVTIASMLARCRPWVLLTTLSIALSFLLVGCSSDALLAAYLDAHRAELQRPASTLPRPVQFEVKPGMSARAIAQELEAAGVITDARLFEAYVRVNGLAGRLEAGTYTLSPDMTPVEIAQVLQRALAPSIRVTIPEGWRLEQTADMLSANGILDGEAYRRLASGSDLGALGELGPEIVAFLRARPTGASLEGYLFPDTYELPAENPSAVDLIRKQLEAFAAKVLPLYQAAHAEGGLQMTLHEVVTLASIVEREAVIAEERPLIAGVYLARLKADMKLEADPTVQYALGYQPDTGQWWKTPVFLEEYDQVASPYNTYLHPGLPPGPIASPGLSSIQAVLHPAQHDYLYFVAAPDGSGRHIFARTFEEHLANVKRYREQIGK